MTTTPDGLPPLDSLPASHLLLAPEVASYLRVDEATLESWRREVRLEGPLFVRLGRGKRSPIRYRVCDLRAWLADNTRTPGGNTEGDSPAPAA